VFKLVLATTKLR